MHQRTNLIPFYLVVDVSQSMAGPRLDTANLILRRLEDALRRDRTAAERVRVGMLDFAGSSRVVLPLCDLLDLDAATLPELECRDDGTRYAPAFDLLRATIDRDHRQLEADSFTVSRPGVFFLSDGEPFDESPEAGAEAFDTLVNECRIPPNFIPCSIADSDRTVMRSLAHPPGTAPLFVQSRLASPEGAIEGLAEVVVQSVLASGRQQMFVIDDTDISALDTVILDPPTTWIDPASGG